MNSKRHLSLNSIISYLFLIGVFCLPLNSDPPAIMQFLGEFRTESASLFFLIALVFLIGRDLVRKKINFPLFQRPYLFFTLFVIYLFIGFVLNISDIQAYMFKGTSGIVRFIKQFVSLTIIAILFFYVFYNVSLIKGVESIFLAIRRFMFYSLVLMSIYGFIEIGIIYLNMGFLLPLTKIFDYFPFVETQLDFYGGRLVGLTFEPPALGTYLVTIAGFMFTYIFTSKGVMRFLPFGLVVFFAILSQSRSAFVIILVEIMVGVIYAYATFPRFRFWFHRGILVIAFLSAGVLTYKYQEISQVVNERIEDLNFFNKSQDNLLSISNRSRLGIQYANLQVFKEHPVIGVGWGQQTYEGISHVPSWSKHKNWEFTYKYLNPSHEPFPPGYNLYIRILAETGIIGFILFLAFIISFIAGMIRVLYQENIEQKYIFLGLLITSMGALINWFQTDTLRLYGFWLCIAIYAAYLNQRKLNYED